MVHRFAAPFLPVSAAEHAPFLPAPISSLQHSYPLWNHPSVIFISYLPLFSHFLYTENSKCFIILFCLFRKQTSTSTAVLTLIYTESPVCYLHLISTSPFLICSTRKILSGFFFRKQTYTAVLTPHT